MNILIVENDLNLNRGIAIVLKDIFDNILTSFTIEEAKDIISKNNIDMMILDLNLPDGDGLDFIKYLRDKNNPIPIMLLTENKLETETLSRLKIGTDDYIIKPFSLIVLKEKIRAMMKRVGIGEIDIYEEENIYFDFNNMIFKINNIEIGLSKTEIKILKKLIVNKNNIVDRETLINEVWGIDRELVDTNALSVAINRLRAKIIYKDKIVNEYGIGYQWKT